MAWVFYLLLVCLPVTVWWSMRTMGFTPVAARRERKDNFDQKAA
jgi:hypothetical protein